MFLLITILSILTITGFVWLFGRFLSFKICPICAGVSGTWLWMFGARFLGYEIDVIFLAMLMGGSVVGIAYQIEKRLSANHSPLLWKTLFISGGFIAVYGIITSWWTISIPAVLVLIIMALAFTGRPHSAVTKNDKAVEELEKKMKNCC